MKPGPVLQSFVGFTLSHILGSWRYTKRSQRWLVTTAALQVLQAALASPLMGLGSPDSTGVIQPDWSLAQAVAQAVSQPGGPAAYLFNNLPPHAGQPYTLPSLFACSCCGHALSVCSKTSALCRRRLCMKNLMLCSSCVSNITLAASNAVWQQIPGTVQMLSLYSSLCDKLLLYRERTSLAGTYKDAPR